MPNILILRLFWWATGVDVREIKIVQKTVMKRA